MPRLVVVIDEFATLVKELPDFVSSMVDGNWSGLVRA
jgi:hypothetical protein